MQRFGLRPTIASCALGAIAVATGCLPREEQSQDQTSKAARQAQDDDDDDDDQERSDRRSSKRKKPNPRLAEAKKDALLTSPFRDDFERVTLGADWRSTGSGWRIHEGELCGQRVRNHPLWLARRLPQNARIEFDATSYSPDGDLKVEVWGDGASSATSASYADATSYIAIFGGWKNRFHVLARLDEHGKDRKVHDVSVESSKPSERAVERGKRYHFVLERQDGKTLVWSVDGIEIHRFVDAQPLKGSGHDHFAFNDWDVRVCFDNLVITPL